MSDAERTAALTTYLAEYSSLRTEQLARLQSQNQAFNYLLIAVGAAVTALISSSGKIPDFSLALIGVALLLPLLTAPLGFIFFDNEMAIHSIGSYLYSILRPKVKTLLGEEDVFGNSLGFHKLNRASGAIHQCLSVARWTLFLLPSWLPVLVVGIYTASHWGWWLVSPPMAPVLPQTPIVPAALLAVFAIDVLGALLLAVAVAWTLTKYRNLAVE